MATQCYTAPYLQASFKGVAFDAMEASSEHGRRGAEGEFPFGENTAYTDLGRRIRTYSLRGRFVSNAHVLESAALIAACEGIGPGILVHPTRGVLNAACKSIRVRDDVIEEQGITYVDLEFVEANLVDNGLTLVGSLLGLILTPVLTASSNEFGTNYNIQSERFYRREEAKETARQATRVCDRAGSCCVNDDSDDCACVDCQDNNRLEFYVMFDGTFDCGIPPQCVVDEINTWMFGSPQGRGLGQVEIGVCGRVIAPTAAKFNMTLDIDDCLSPSQQNDIKAAILDYMSTRCPSEDVNIQSIEAVISQVIGADTTFEVTFAPHEGTEACLEISRCGDLLVACDCMPCLDELTFEGPAFQPSDCL